jgi:large-conductance mechanosensitive channel
VLAALCCGDALAQTVLPIDPNEVIVCPATSDSETPPAFNEPGCNTVTAAEIDPQNKALWLKAKLELPDQVLKNDQPYAIYVYAKTSSRVFFNGHYLGQNGTPSLSANKEFAGLMDTSFYLPPDLIKQNHNELVLQLSSHHGFLQLKTPIHFIGLGSYALQASSIWQDNWLSLIPLGALIMGTLYFAVSSFTPYRRQSHLLFFLMALFAASQLLAELSRPLFSYTYPMHDVRLLLIVSFAMGFGCSLWVYNVRKFAERHKALWIGGGIALTLATVLLVTGFDTKTSTAILMPALLSTLLIAYRLTQQRSLTLWLFLLVYGLLSAAIQLSLGRFHDSLFYYLISLVLGFLFVQQAQELSKEQARRKTEEQQVAKLQLKLDQLQQKQQPHKLKISSAGKVEWVSTDSLVYCKAAGDYTELFFSDQKSILYSGNLKELENQLPSTFLRVHRSYVVNTDCIAALEKSTSQQNTAASTGFLLMNNGEQVPVSRRILPMVRSALG